MQLGQMIVKMRKDYGLTQDCNILAVFIKKQKYPLKILGLCSIIFTICEDINCLVPTDQNKAVLCLHKLPFVLYF